MTDGKKCFPSAGQTVTNAMWCTEGEGERIKIPQQDNTPLEHMDLPKPCQMRKQVQVRRHQGNMKKEKKPGSKLVAIPVSLVTGAKSTPQNQTQPLRE